MYPEKWLIALLFSFLCTMYVLDSRMLKTMRDEFKSFSTLLTRQQTSSKLGLIFKKCLLLEFRERKIIKFQTLVFLKFIYWNGYLWDIFVLHQILMKHNEIEISLWYSTSPNFIKIKCFINVSFNRWVITLTWSWLNYTRSLDSAHFGPLFKISFKKALIWESTLWCRLKNSPKRGFWKFP